MTRTDQAVRSGSGMMHSSRPSLDVNMWMMHMHKSSTTAALLLTLNVL